MQASSGQHELHSEEHRFVAPSFPGLRSLAAGAAGGVCSVLVGHPFDLVKVRLQTANRATRRSAVSVLKSNLTGERGIRGIYSGVSAPLMGVTPIYAVSFWGYDVGKSLVQKPSPGIEPATSDLSIAQIFAAGLLSAVPMTLISAPFERLKILLQVQGQKFHKKKHHKKAPSGVTTILCGLYHQGGIRSIYRGSLMTFARDAPDSAAYFATYEYCKRRFTSESDNGTVGSPNFFAISGAGASAGLVMSVPLFPIDTVKSRLQAAEGKQTVRSTVKHVHNNGRIRAFFPGIGPALLRAVPANAAVTLDGRWHGWSWTPFECGAEWRNRWNLMRAIHSRPYSSETPFG